MPALPNLFAISDLHVGYAENRRIVDGLRPSTDLDWLLVAGDVGEFAADVEWVLAKLSERFEKVVWAPGNHELWTPREDPVRLRGDARYRYLVERCRSLGVVTPEDTYPVWAGPAGPVTIAPLFLLYDYSYLPPGLGTKEEALAAAYEAGVVCSDEFLLHPDPYPSREAWSRARVAETEQRLAALDPDMPTVLVSHWPLVREPARVLLRQQFSLWCGTESTAQWHVKFHAQAAVFGHLHIPRGQWIDGVRFEEVSLGYPREWRQRGGEPGKLRRILPPGLGRA